MSCHTVKARGKTRDFEKMERTKMGHDTKNIFKQSLGIKEQEIHLRLNLSLQ